MFSHGFGGPIVSMHLAPHFSGFFLLSRSLLKVFFVPSSSPEWIKALKMPIDVTSLLGRLLWLSSLSSSWKSKSVSVWNLTVLFSIKQVLSPPGSGALKSRQWHLLKRPMNTNKAICSVLNVALWLRETFFSVLRLFPPFDLQCHHPVLCLALQFLKFLLIKHWERGRVCPWTHRPF